MFCRQYVFHFILVQSCEIPPNFASRRSLTMSMLLVLRFSLLIWQAASMRAQGQQKDRVCVFVKPSECPGTDQVRFFDEGWKPAAEVKDDEVMCCREDPPYDIIWTRGSPEQCKLHGFMYLNHTHAKDGKTCATVDWPYASCFSASPDYCGPPSYMIPLQRTEQRKGNPIDGTELLSHSYSGWGYKYLGNNQCCWLSSSRRFANFVCRETKLASVGCHYTTLATSEEFGTDMGPDPTSSNGLHRCCGTTQVDVQVLPAADPVH